MSSPAQPYRIIDFDAIPAVPCPCGISRRALGDAADFPGSIHRTDIDCDAKAHFHRRLTETYYILECGPAAQIELDGERVPLRPGMCVFIPPGVVHRGIGRMRVLILVFPKFDPADEVVVEPR